MKIYDTKEEAMEAAEALRVQLVDGHFYTVMNRTDSNMGVLYNNHTSAVTAEFRFKPERVAPAKNTTMRSNVWKGIYYSMGEFDDSGRLKCSERPDGCGDTYNLLGYTPVDITPAGQFAKALELLERWNDNDADSDWEVYATDVAKLLDEIKAGGGE